MQKWPRPLSLTLTFLSMSTQTQTSSPSSHEQYKHEQPLDNMGPRSTGDLIPPTLRQTPTTSLPRPMPDLTRLYTKDPWAESSDDEDLGSPFFATPSHRLVVSRRPGVPGQWSNSPVHASSSVSPITMSAQKMSRAMQVRVEMSTCAVQG